MMKAKILVIAVVWILSGFISAQVQGQPCGCADKKDLLNRLNVIEAAITEYGVQIEGMKVKEKDSGKPLMLTQELYLIMEERINEAMKVVKDSTANSGTAQTNGGDCKLNFVKAPTNCLTESLTRHEKIHQTACLAVKASLGLTETYQTKMRLADFAQEEINAYQAERTFILAQLKALPILCRPSDWFGFVVYQQTELMETNKTIPPKNTTYPKPSAGITITNGGNSSQIINSGYLGTIFVEQGKITSARAGSNYSRNYTSNLNGRIFCNYKVKPDLSFSNTISDVEQLSGEQTGKADFNLSVYSATKELSIFISFFPIQITGARNMTESNPAPCLGQQERKNSVSLTNRKTVSPYTLKGKFTNDDFLSGNQTEQPPLLQINSKTATVSFNSSYTINTRWMLRRLPN